MRRFTKYQYLKTNIKMDPMDGEGERVSKFWDKGKWDNYVRPYLPKHIRGKELVYVDMGCNAGLFMQFAKDAGFQRAVGVEVNPEAVERGLDYKKKTGGDYKIITGRMEEMIDELPVCDYMTFINTHYYLLIQDWLELISTLRKKARHVIITGTRKKEYYCMASAYGGNIKTYFKDWELVGSIAQKPTDGDPRPRSLTSYCFKNPDLERVPLEKLGRGNHVRSDFKKDLQDIENGVQPLSTEYFKKLLEYKKRTPRDDLIDWTYRKMGMYWGVKEDGLKEPIIVNKRYRILDGNHRKLALEFLGYKTAIVRKT